MSSLSALIAGLVFGVGLAVSGMTEPANIIAFLRLGPGWDPTLLVVLGSAVVVTAIGYRLVQRRAAPLWEGAFRIPTATAIDARLLGGAAVFGVGWGLAGYCPGPAIVGAATLDARALAFLAAFLIGAAAYRGWAVREIRTASRPVDG